MINWIKTKDDFGDMIEIYKNGPWVIEHTKTFGREYRVKYRGQGIQDFCKLKKARKAVEYNESIGFIPQ